MTKIINFTYHLNPNIYIDYKDLTDPFTIEIPISITNSETITLYFRVMLVNPPTDYTEHDVQLGAVNAGASAYKTWTITRTLPTSKTTDNLIARLMAYRDSDYTDLYGYKDLSLNFYLFNRDDGTLIDSDTFDSGSNEGWQGDSGPTLYASPSGKTYLSSPYGLKCRRSDNYHYQFFESVWLNGELIIPSTVRPPTQNWYRIVIPLAPSQTNTIKFSTTSLGQYGIYKSWNIGNVSEAYAIIHWRRGTMESSADGLDVGDAIDNVYIITFP